MNPEIIYTNFRDEALASVFSLPSYSTFVAMPFQDRYSYRPEEVLEGVIRRGAIEANRRRDPSHYEFAQPDTVGHAPPTANVITEEIVRSILFSTFFLADLTDGNPGVLIETGIAMAFKPNTQIILITQDPIERLHFDIRNNRVINYNTDDAIANIANAFLAAARSFESDRSRYATEVSRGLRGGPRNSDSGVRWKPLRRRDHEDERKEEAVRG
jgi:hypothetical protein